MPNKKIIGSILWDIDFKNHKRLRLEIKGFKDNREREDFCKIVSKLKRGFSRYYFTFLDNGHLAFVDELDSEEFNKWAEEVRVLESFRLKIAEDNKKKLAKNYRKSHAK
jgi:hypothetical protein